MAPTIYSGLTPQERKVLDKILENGCSNKELAATFKISEETVKRHLTNIMDKGGWAHRTEMVANCLHRKYRGAMELDWRAFHLDS